MHRAWPSMAVKNTTDDIVRIVCRPHGADFDCYPKGKVLTCREQTDDLGLDPDKNVIGRWPTRRNTGYTDNIELGGLTPSNDRFDWRLLAQYGLFNAYLNLRGDTCIAVPV
jgi:hypothetical protein